MESKYLSFIELTPKPKTKVFAVENKQSGDLLGHVYWYAPWRKYCFFTPAQELVFDSGCLLEILNFINVLMLERRKK